MGGDCHEGYHNCETCCDWNGDCKCDQTCDENDGHTSPANWLGQCSYTYEEGPGCNPCNCDKWDGSNYSECRPITESKPCTEYCVLCEADGVTALPGSHEE